MTCRIFSGIQPTGRKHLGNYIGAIRQYVEGQDRGEAIYCIVDLHAITVRLRPGRAARAPVYDTTAILLAAGLDPERCILFRQSDVREHTELAWLLSAVTAWGDLNRMHQWKEKRELEQRRRVRLRGAVLLPGPAGGRRARLPRRRGAGRRRPAPAHRADARDRAALQRALRRDPGRPRAPHPRGRRADHGPPGPDSKMSTTGGAEQGTVYVLDEPDAVRKKVRSAVTDSGTEVRRGPDKAGIANLIEILSVVRGVAPEQVEGEFEGSGYGDFKAAVAEAVVDYLAPVRERYAELRPTRRARATLAAGRREGARDRLRDGRRRPRGDGHRPSRELSREAALPLRHDAMRAAELDLDLDVFAGRSTS